MKFPSSWGFYGLRRSEVLGQKWCAIDFQNNTITIRRTVTSCNLDGKHVQIAQDTTKTKSSLRTLPLVPAFKEKLLAQKSSRTNTGVCAASATTKGIWTASA